MSVFVMLLLPPPPLPALELEYRFHARVSTALHGFRAEAVVLPVAVAVSQNWIRSTPTHGAKALAATQGGGGWHVDDLLHFPLPEGHPPHSTVAPPPIFILQLFVLLTDVPDRTYGPTEVWVIET